MRKKQGYTLKKLSTLLDVSINFVSLLELGKKTPNIAMALRITNTFNVTTGQPIRDELEVDKPL